MEKTIKILLQEAYVDGYNDARKAIAEEIEDKRKPYIELARDKESIDKDFYNGFCNAMNFANLIARGKPE